jgi:hypothetical protein
MRARACIKCKEYVVIHPNNPLNQSQLNLFEKSHRQHTLVTVNYDEIKDSYKAFRNNGHNDSIEYNSES